MNYKTKQSFINQFLLVVLFFSLCFNSIEAQKINPDLNKTKVKTKTEVIYKSKNSSEELKSVKSVIDSKGTNYVLFCDGYQGTAYLASGKTGNWKTEVLAGNKADGPTQGEGTRYLAMDIDKNDGLHIVLVGYPGTMYYGYRKSGSVKWEFTIVSRDEMPQLQNFYIYENYIDMAVDQKGGVHIAAFSEIKSGNSSIYFYKTPGGEWSSEVVRLGKANTKKDYGREPSIVVSGSKVAMSFGGGWSLTYAEKTIGESRWDIQELINEEKNEPQKHSTNLILNPDGKPILSFRDYKGGELRGVNVLIKDQCNDEWLRSSVGDGSSSGNAIALDKHGVIWLAYCNDGGYTKLAYRNCMADRSWKNALKLNDLSKIFLDMFVDANNHVHLFYSTYEDEIKHVEAWFDGISEIDNNIMPVITSKMKPRIKTGDFWKTTLKAYDRECDNITFYSDNLPAGFTLTDHENGLATLKSEVINKVGEYKFKVYVVDDQHEKGKKPVSGISVKLNVSKKGNKKGSYKVFYDEGSFSKYKWMGLDGVIKKAESVGTKVGATETMETSGSSPNNQPAATPAIGASSDCTEYLDRFEAWAEKYIEVKKKVNSNPMDFGSVTKLASMAPEVGNWGLEWQQKHECANDPEFVKRFEAINEKIDSVNN